MTTDEHAERCTLLRPLLFMIVHEMPGSATESDGVLVLGEEGNDQ